MTLDALDRRKHQRHDIELDFRCQKVGVSCDDFFSGQTINISTGGLLAHTEHSDIEIGELLNVHLSVPPSHGQLELGGRFEGFAKVTRIDTQNESEIQRKKRLLALQFCSSPKLSV